MARISMPPVDKIWFCKPVAKCMKKAKEMGIEFDLSVLL